MHATHPKNDDTDDETDDDDDAIVEFDDFGGQVIGGGGDDDNYESRSRSSTAASSSSSSTILADRIQTMQRQEQRQEAVYARNWKLGNWQVRGFSLEDGTTTSSNDDGSGSSGDGAVIPSVCRIVPAAALSSDNASPQRIDIWVGRTDGSVFGVRLGDAYWTKLTTATDSGENDETASTVTGGPELERKMERIDDEDEEEFASQGDFGSENDTSKPFEIVTQIQAGEAAVSAMIAVEDEDEERSYLFTATIAPGGEIKQWTTDQDYQALSSKTLSSAHASSVIALKAVAQENDAYVLLSADRTSLAVWDVVTGELLGQVVVEVSSDDRDGSSTCNSPVIQCVDTDGVHVYVGTVTGHIKAYAVKDILQSRTSVAGNWRASDCPVTALTCGGPGTLGRGRPGSDTIVLYTGDAEGTVKQWEVFAANDKLQQWPKLATQRMPKKAHLFKGHEGSVTAILAIDAVKFVSAGSDGTGM